MKETFGGIQNLQVHLSKGKHIKFFDMAHSAMHVLHSYSAFNYIVSIIRPGVN